MSAYLYSNLCTLTQALPTHVLHVPSILDVNGSYNPIKSGGGGGGGVGGETRAGGGVCKKPHPLCTPSSTFTCLERSIFSLHRMVMLCSGT